MKTFLILLFAITVASASKTHAKRATYTASLNDYADKVISNLQAYLVEQSGDSISLPNVTESFSTKPLLVTYSGSLYLYGGALSNLATVKRYGDVTLSYSNKVLGLSANMGIDRVQVDYTYYAKLLFMSAQGRVVGTALKIDTDTAVTVDLENYVISLDSFIVNSVGKISAKLRGNALVDWLANVVLKIVLRIIKSDVISQFQTTATTSIEGVLEEASSYLASLMS